MDDLVTVRVVIRRPTRVKVVVVDDRTPEHEPDGGPPFSDRAVTERWQKYLRRRKRPQSVDGWRSE